MASSARSSPDSLRIAACVSLVVLPHRRLASRISIFGSSPSLPPSIHRYTGFSDAPSTIRASNPARLSCAAQLPPTSLAPNPPVVGDLAPTALRDAPEIARPVSTPGAKISLFSSPRGSAPGGTSRKRTSAMIFQPPMYRRR